MANVNKIDSNADRARQQFTLLDYVFPVEEISLSCAREKSIRHGHISTLQQWWARRPLAVCRAALFTALCAHPADIAKDSLLLAALVKHTVGEQPNAPQHKHQLPLSSSVSKLDKAPLSELFSEIPPSQSVVTELLASFSTKLSKWEAANDRALLDLAQRLIMAGRNEVPVVMDSFAGGGSFPVEALRLRVNALAGDLNPVVTAALRIAVEYLPGSNQKILQCYKEVSAALSESIEKATRHLYQSRDDKTPLAYFWALTYLCPECSIEVPLLQSNWLARGRREIAVRLHATASSDRFLFELFSPATDDAYKTVRNGTVSRKGAICPRCYHKVSTKWLREQGKNGCLHDRLYAKLVLDADGNRVYEEIDHFDEVQARECKLRELAEREHLSVPDEEMNKNGIRHTWSMQYGITTTSDLYNHRQQIALLEVLHELSTIKQELQKERRPVKEIQAIAVLLSLTFNRLISYGTKHAWWQSNGEFPASMYTKQAIPLVWNYVEIPVNSPAAAGWASASSWIQKAVEHLVKLERSGRVWQGDAASVPVATGSVDLVAIDPPYYDSIAYSYLSDVYYVWMKPLIADIFPNDFVNPLSPKTEEAIVDRPHRLAPSPKTKQHFFIKMKQALLEARRVLRPDGRLLVMYGHKKFEAWAVFLEAIFDAGFQLTASWPVHTERKAKFQHGQIDALSSSCLLVCGLSDATSQERIAWPDFEVLLKDCLTERMQRFEIGHFWGSDLLAALIAPACQLYRRHRVATLEGLDLDIENLLKRLPKIVSDCQQDLLLNRSILHQEPPLIEILHTLSSSNGTRENKERTSYRQTSWLALASEHHIVGLAAEYAHLLRDRKPKKADELWEGLTELDRQLMLQFLRGAALLSPKNSVEQQLASASLGRISHKQLAHNHSS